MIQYWKFASYIVNIPAERGVRRALSWNTSNKSFPWAPTTNLGHKTGKVLQAQSFEQLGKGCEKCGSMGCFAADFPTFLFHVKAATTFSERRLQVVQSLVCTYIYFFFSVSALTLGSPTGVGADLT